MHRHKYSGRKFGRQAGHRDLMLRNLATSLLLHEKVTTTLAKAKEIRPIVEKLITKAQKGDFNAYRALNAYLLDKNATEKTVTELAPLYKERNGGYLRIIKLGTRVGDAAEMAVIELIDTEKLVKKAPKEKAEKTVAVETKKPAAKTRTRKPAAKKETK